jgi:hypothetical protein
MNSDSQSWNTLQRGNDTVSDRERVVTKQRVAEAALNLANPSTGLLQFFPLAERSSLYATGTIVWSRVAGCFCLATTKKPL